MAGDVVLLWSPDPAFANDVGSHLGAGVSIAVTDAASDVVPSVERVKPVVVVADCRRVNDGGHGSDRLLDMLQSRHPDLPLVLLTADDCPEPLERRAACTPLVHLRGVLTADSVAAAVRTRLPGAAEPGTAAVGETTHVAHDDFADVVLEGVTRRFETNSPQLRRMLEDLAIAAAHDVTILLIGETGSGKTYLSQLIHEASPRRDQPFLHVACGALPRELIESELFGHVKGAFTSAHADKDGKFLAAGRGTILLDEIDVLGPEQQVKLLRVIETGEFEPIGSNRTQRSQARLVVASNLDLQPLVEQGRFRPDLYYRLNMLKFDLPPLRKRRMDVVPLARRFINRFQEKHGVEVRRIDDAFLASLVEYPWPGNVRELEHVVQRAVIYCRHGELTADHLPPHIVAGVAGPVNDPSVRLPGRSSALDTSLEMQVALSEKEIIESALLRNSFSRTNTAKDLGISRVTLYNKMKRYQMLK
jgi:DNA-binding NtrC family response regulator